MESLPPLILALKRHLEQEGAVSLHETHISWVLVGAERVWKLKKPLDLGFLDYSTLEKRLHAYEQELLLNRRTLPELYQRVVSISGTPEQPLPDAEGTPIAYALEMVPFDESDLLLHRLRAGELDANTIDTLADTIAELHTGFEPAPAESHYGTPEAVAAPMRENFTQIIHYLPQLADGPLAELSAWTERELSRLRPLLEQRKRQGYIRPCHGDLHLGNIVLWQGEPRPFDCIEFNPDLSTIDTLSEVAFTCMDLQVEGRSDLAARLLSHYLERMDDHAALPLLALYTVYRAMVRAKVAAIRAAQGDASAQQAVQHYLALALACMRSRPPRLWLTSGLSASGKSTLALGVVEQLGAIRLRADVERKRLFGLAGDARSDSAVGSGLYSAEATERTYARLAELAEVVLGAGRSVVIDATCLRQWQRQRFISLAERMGVEWQLLLLELPEAQLRQRIERRLLKGADVSEATPAVLAAQIEQRETLSAREQAHALHFTEARGDEVVQRLRALADG